MFSFRQPKGFSHTASGLVGCASQGLAARALFPKPQRRSLRHRHKDYRGSLQTASSKSRRAQPKGKTLERIPKAKPALYVERPVILAHEGFFWRVLDGRSANAIHWVLKPLGWGLPVFADEDVFVAFPQLFLRRLARAKMLFEAYSPPTWSFDVSSLMVLVGEKEEQQYRLSQRSLAQCLSAAPVVGLQNYIRSYNMVLEPGSLTYLSPYGRKQSPLRNMRLENTIRINRLLKDGIFSIFSVPATTMPANHRLRSWQFLLLLWVAFTWACFAGLIIFLVLDPTTTWIGLSNCVVFTGWSIILRVVEHIVVRPAKIKPGSVSGPDDPDAIIIMGRNNSAFVLEGSRSDIKHWTTRGLVYALDSSVGAAACQAFTRAGSMLVLLLVFTTLPNGALRDQLAFILLNALAQANVLVGEFLNSKCCLSALHRSPSRSAKVDTRTQVYAHLLRNFKHLPREWIKNSGLIPETDVWQEWQKRVVTDDNISPGGLYDRIVAEVHEKERAHSQELATAAP